ncbi:MAG: cation diffusion facilitator family transporter [Candidatus Azotimanducaceae bacterium]|jgi:cation diffusion facilitator family transporter
MSDTRKSNRQETQRLLILSGVLDAALGFLKVAVGVLANSHALIADGIHSFSDLVTDVLVWIFNKIGANDPDDEHPYGHAKFETFGTLILGIILILVAAGLIFDSMQRLLDVEAVSIPAWPAIAAALVSIAAKEWLYRITQALGNKTKSRLLLANAWHHRSDALSSVIVLIGVGGAMVGVLWLEMLAAMGVALMIAQIGWKLSRQSVEELVDTALAESYVDQIKEKIEGVEGVRGVHSIRTRRMGNDVLADIHLQVEPFISVSEGHHIGEWVTHEITSFFNELNDVIVHIDAEDDELIETDARQSLPPLRREARELLMALWQSEISPEHVYKLTLHYLNWGIHAEVFLNRAVYADSKKNKAGSLTPGLPKTKIEGQALAAELQAKAAAIPWLHKVSVWFD